MPIIVDIDVMLAKRKMAVGTLADLVGITPANLGDYVRAGCSGAGLGSDIYRPGQDTARSAAKASSTRSPEWETLKWSGVPGSCGFPLRPATISSRSAGTSRYAASRRRSRPRAAT